MPDRKKGGKNRKREPYDFASFPGYRGPRFTPIPDEFLDHQLADLSSAEAKVMLFLFRKTYGYRKSGDRVSFSQLQYGTVAADGTIIDRGTGLSKATIWRALKSLQQKGLIQVYRTTTRAGDPDVNYYRIREYSSPADPPVNAPGNPGRPTGTSPSPPASEEGSNNPNPAPKPINEPDNGLFTSETTPASQLNHPPIKTKPRGSLTPKPTREDCTRQDYTLSRAIADLALDFLKAIGYSKPARAKRERTKHILTTLAREEGYTLDDLHAACEIAASLGARGPELIPHVVGQQPHTEPEVGERIAQAEQQERERWQALKDQFQLLSAADQHQLLLQAQQSNPILAKRPLDHPLIHAAALRLLEAKNSG